MDSSKQIGPERDSLRTMVAVTARLSGRDLGSAMAEIQRRVRREVALRQIIELSATRPVLGAGSGS